ncbi:hypothetical protein GTP45_07700 [Pseudoduganella sp. FT55W]|uniref:Uncharacterized protein n=1 Tax=Duganella rivi TaxID=2666083 RepID=A0A7X4GPC7_9BURK|nr:hypothetical protein [Duganella rivi]MYM66710.1 hypothetical protein [Duganella rivi]
MKTTLSITTKRDGARIHRLIDDTHYPTRTRQPEIRRDPMVAALFGAAAAPASKREGAQSSRGAPPTSTRSA